MGVEEMSPTSHPRTSPETRRYHGRGELSTVVGDHVEPGSEMWERVIDIIADQLPEDVDEIETEWSWTGDKTGRVLTVRAVR
jgi:hypothetical protein